MIEEGEGRYRSMTMPEHYVNRDLHLICQRFKFNGACVPETYKKYQKACKVTERWIQII